MVEVALANRFYWIGAKPEVPQTTGAGAPVGSPRITPEASEHRVRCPLEPGTIGLAVELKSTNGLMVVPAPFDPTEVNAYPLFVPLPKLLSSRQASAADGTPHPPAGVLRLPRPAA